MTSNSKTGKINSTRGPWDPAGVEYYRKTRNLFQ